MTCNKIPSHDDNIVLRQKRETARVFSLCQRDGIVLKAIAMDSGIGYTTIQSYARGEAVMSIASLFRLIGVIPDEYLSILLPEGRHIVAAPDDIDHDALCDLATDYVDTKMAAHKADSPDGVAISECENAALIGKATRLKVAA